MTIFNPLPYECVQETDATPDIWGVYPENAMLRAQIEKNDELLDTFMKTIAEQQHEIRCLKDRSDYNATIFKNQFHAINTFFKWVMDHYEIDKQDDIWEMLDGMFEDGLLTDPRKRVYRIRVTKQDVSEYDIEFPWDMNDERAQEIVRDNVISGVFNRDNFQDVSFLDGRPISVVAHNNIGADWTVWSRGQINGSNESPW